MVTPPTPPPDRAENDILVSEMIAGAVPMSLGRGCWCQTRACVVQNGLEVLYWSGCFEQLQEIPLVDDSNRICFSFNSCVSGGAECLFEDGAQRGYEIFNNSGSIQYGPGRRGVYRQQGEMRNLAVMVHPDLFITWVGEMDPALKEILAFGGILDGYRGSELLATTQALRGALAPASTVGEPPVGRHPLWLQAQCMTFVSLFLEAQAPAPAAAVAAADRRRLLRARDLLLADLGRAPGLTDLAKEVGLSAPTLTRGFRRLFGASPFALFQQERMERARVRLMSGEESIMRIAADLGYTNAGHFAEAFRKQFGVLPSEFKRQIRARGADLLR